MRVTMKRVSRLFMGSMFQNVQELNANLRLTMKREKTPNAWHANTINCLLPLRVRRAPVSNPSRGSCFRDYEGRQLD